MGDDKRAEALHEVRMRLMDRVEETRDEDGAYHPTRLANAAPDNVTQAEILDGLKDLEAAGLLVSREEYSGAEDSRTVSLAGRTALQERARFRGDVRARNEQCRRAVIEWLYTVKHDDRPLDEGNWHRFGEVEGNVWIGRPFPDSAISKASKWLYEEGLISGIASHGHDRIERPEITARGEAWLEDQDRPRAAAEPDGGARYYFSGNTNFNAVDRSPGANISQHGSISDESQRVLLQRIDAVDQALALAPLSDPAAQAEAEDAARAVRAEAESPAPNRGRLAAAGRRLTDATATGVGAAAGNALVESAVAALTQVLS